MEKILEPISDADAATKEKASLVRKWCLISTTDAGSGHPTSCLSAADMATVLFDKYFTYDIKNPLNIYNDRFLLSKGHAAPLLYALFGMAGAYPLETLRSLRKFGSLFQGHPVSRFEHCDAATGSLGQGLSVGAGLALIAKKDKIPNKTYVLMGDGELAEGQVWEAANFISFHQLHNLVAIADINCMGQSGKTMFGHDLEKYADRFRSFGFEVVTINGHDIKECSDALQFADNNLVGKPVVIIMETIKGKGISFLEDKEGWHGKALDKQQLQKALDELGSTDDDLHFDLKKPVKTKIARVQKIFGVDSLRFDKGSELGIREAFGASLVRQGEQNQQIYVLDGDVKNSTFTQDFAKAFPDRFIECYIAEQNMVSVAVGLSRLGKIPVVATFGAFFTRAADQIRMAKISESNIKFVGSHAGVSIGEDGPSQMALEDIALFGTLPGMVIIQPADAVAASKLTALMVEHQGFVYMRTIRPKTEVIYNNEENFRIGGSKILLQSGYDLLTIAATGISVYEALKAAHLLKLEGIHVRVVDCYSINPVDIETLSKCLRETSKSIIITVEDHFIHGGMGDFVLAALGEPERSVYIEKMAVKRISQSGKMEQLLEDAGISAKKIFERVIEISMK